MHTEKTYTVTEIAKELVFLNTMGITLFNTDRTFYPVMELLC